MKNILETQKLNLGYSDTEILNNINLQVKRGSVTTIIGVNGSGKSTLIKALSRTLTPKNGNVILDGKNIRKMKNKDIAKLLSILPQIHSAPEDFTVYDLVSYGRHPYLRFSQRLTDDDKEIINWALESSKMKSLQNRYVSTLSGGERQRAWFAMCLAQQPDVLLLDEPTTFLDISHQFEVLELVKELNEKHGITIVMVLHDINQAVRYSKEIIVIKNGDIYQRGNPKKIITLELLKDVFGIGGRIVSDENYDYSVFIPEYTY